MVDGMASAPAYSFVHTGHLAEPLLVTDAAGAVVSSITRDPWGNAILLAGTAAIRLGYPGQWHDGTSGLYQNWHRDYDPTLGRYMETDPIGLAGGTNLYAYVGGNPVNVVDPRGEFGLPGLVGGAALSIGSQVAVNMASGASLSQALRCIDLGDVVVSAVAGALGPTLVGNVLLGGANPWGLTRAQSAVSYFSTFLPGSAAFKIATPSLRLGDDCECENFGWGAAAGRLIQW
ncbi:MAG: RHS repeat-associated core domain-containing protein [Novosphingobium sp.]